MILFLFKASICLVRHHDGIIYNTGFHYTYHSQTSPTSSCSVSAKQNFELKHNSNNNVHRGMSKDNLTIYVPKPSLKRHSINFD